MIENGNITMVSNTIIIHNNITLANVLYNLQFNANILYNVLVTSNYMIICSTVAMICMLPFNTVVKMVHYNF